MTKILEAYCTIHFRDGDKVLAADTDVALSWAGQALTLDLCAQHRRDIDAGGWTLADLLKLGDPAPPAALTKRRAPAAAIEDRGYKDAEGKWQQPAGRTADAIRKWARRHEIMSRDDGPERLAYQNKSGHGNYFPIWLLQAYDERDQPKEPAA